MEEDFCGENPGVWQEMVMECFFDINEREQQYVHVKSQPSSSSVYGPISNRVGLLLIAFPFQGC